MISASNGRTNVCREVPLLAAGGRRSVWYSMVPDTMKEAIPNFVSMNKRHTLRYMSVQLAEAQKIVIGPPSRGVCRLE